MKRLSLLRSSGAEGDSRTLGLVLTSFCIRFFRCGSRLCSSWTGGTIAVQQSSDPNPCWRLRVTRCVPLLLNCCMAAMTVLYAGHVARVRSLREKRCTQRWPIWLAVSEMCCATMHRIVFTRHAELSSIDSYLEKLVATMVLILIVTIVKVVLVLLVGIIAIVYLAAEE